MTSLQHDTRQIKTITKVYELKKEKIKNQIYQVDGSITKKQQSILRFQEYADSYAAKCDSMNFNTIQIIKNNQAFYQNLAQVIDSEKKDLMRLETIRKELIGSYTVYVRKMDGLNNLCQQLDRENMVVLEKVEDSENYDVAISIATRELLL